MVKKGQLEVSKMDSPKQGQRRDPEGPKPQLARNEWNEETRDQEVY